MNLVGDRRRAANQEDQDLIRQYVLPDNVLFLEAQTKGEVLSSLMSALASAPDAVDGAALEEAILHRESLMSTGIGQGIGAPHAQLASARKMTVFVGVSRAGITDYESMDGEPVHLVFMIAIPAGKRDGYLRLLRSLMPRLRRIESRERLMATADGAGFLSILLQIGNEP